MNDMSQYYTRWKSRAFHFKEKSEEDPKEAVSPPGWKGTVEKMKDKDDIDNPWALSWWMKNKDYKPHYTEKGKKKKSKVIHCQYNGK